jgi:hypothetical protein
MHPTFVANGDNGEMMRTKNSYLLGEHLLTHTSGSTRTPITAFLYQYPELFGDHVRVFLSG